MPCQLAAAWAFCFFGLLRVSAVAEDFDIHEATLSDNDECDGGGSECALSALQRKGTIISDAREGGLTNVSNSVPTTWTMSDETPNYDDTADEDELDRLKLANPQEDLGSSNGGLRHYSMTCWSHCGNKYGFCENYCGRGNACCRYPGGGDQPQECQNHASVHWWPVRTWSTCVISHFHVATTTAAPPAITNSETKTLYQMTSPANAKSIIEGQFRPGHGGWCGAAIYFIDHPHLKKTKYNPRTTKTGAYVVAQVQMGKTCRMKKTCNNGASGKCCTDPQTGGHATSGAQNAGCNSIVWNPGDGDEYIIWHPEQVISRKLYKCTHRECKNLFPDLTFGQDGVVQQDSADSPQGSPDACPANYPKCQAKSGDCVTYSEFGKTEHTWVEADKPDDVPGEYPDDYTYLHGTDGDGKLCKSDYQNPR